MGEPVKLPRLPILPAYVEVRRVFIASGQAVRRGELLAELACDGLRVECGAPFDGFVREVLIRPGDSLPSFGGSELFVIESLSQFYNARRVPNGLSQERRRKTP